MEANRCPFLGLPDDPDTRLDFPSPGNVCHKASPSGPIKVDYQHHTCLTGQHAQCPIYTAAQPVPVPNALLAAAPRIRLPQSLTSLGRLPLVLGGVVLVGFILFALSGILGNFNTNASGQGGSGPERTRAGFMGMPQTGGSQITVVPNPTNARRHTTCPPPEGWVSYVVNPTDSLYRLSVVHGVPVEELQRANCMGEEKVILPGQVIYIPFTPTLTPIATATPTRFFPSSTFTTAPGNNNPPPVNTATDEPPTDTPPTRTPTTAVPPATTVPTTAVPPTSVPPTRVPPTQVPTTAVPPTAVVPTARPTTAPIIPPILPTILPTILPPIFPTAAPTNTPAPPSNPGGGTNNDRSETIDCGGGTVTVDGNNNNVTITGACLGVVVNGNNNEVKVPRGTPVQDRGKNNVIKEG